MRIDTPLARALGLEQPIIQAPMAGANATPPELVSAVSNAGGLGFIGAAYMSPAQIADMARETKARTPRAFGINLFAPMAAPELSANVERALDALAPYHAELGLAPPVLPGPPSVSFDDQLAAVLECGARTFSFTFGLIPTAALRALQARDVYVIGTATTVDEAIALEESGVNAIVAQGGEAGAHRGTFLRPVADSLIGTIALVPQVVDAVKVPVIASGGIMDGRGIAAALMLGASAVQMGTAFLTTTECGIARSYKAAILGANENDTRITRAFSGREARGIVNRVMSEVELNNANPPILPYPIQNALTRPMRNAATQQERPEFLSLWAGQGIRLSRSLSAAELVARLAEETDVALARGTAVTIPDRGAPRR
jgi:nitronate monooxygenase